MDLDVGFNLGAVLLWMVGLYGILEKAGVAPWKALIPVYNFYCYVKVCGRPGWWMALFLIPFVNLVILLVLGLDLARRFGKSPLYGCGLAFLGIVFMPLLGWVDRAKYIPVEKEKKPVTKAVAKQARPAESASKVEPKLLGNDEPVKKD